MNQALRSNLLFPSQCHFDWDLVSSWRGDRGLSAYSKSPTVGNWQTCFVLVFLVVRFFVVVRILTFHFDGSFCNCPKPKPVSLCLRLKAKNIMVCTMSFLRRGVHAGHRMWSLEFVLYDLGFKGASQIRQHSPSPSPPSAHYEPASLKPATWNLSP